jgi:peptide/nickel transport system substrate-binding protein
VLSNVYETLVEVDPNLGLRAGLAELWYSSDDSAWVFRLRAGIRLHDGRSLGAADVANSLEHARADTESARRGELADIRAIDIRDERTLVVHTNAPSDTLPARLGNVFIWAPAERAGDPGVGTGPYHLRSGTPSGDTFLDAFPLYSGRPPSIPSVEFKAIPDSGERARQLLGGQVHILVDPPIEQMASFRSGPGFKVISRRGRRVVFLGMDGTREKTPYAESAANPFLDRRVRLAIALAIDRRALAEDVLGGFAESLDQIASPDELGTLKDRVFARPWDPEAARRLLTAAGYPRGFSVALDFDTSPDTEAVAKAVASDLAAVGVRVIERPVPEAEVIGRVERRDTSLYLLVWLSPTGDARTSYASLLHSPVGGLGRDNGGGHSDVSMDRLIETGYGRATPDERGLLLTRLAAKVALDVPIIPLLRTNDSYVVARELEFTPRLDRLIRATEIRWKRPQ